MLKTSERKNLGATRKHHNGILIIFCSTKSVAFLLFCSRSLSILCGGHSLRSWLAYYHNFSLLIRTLCACSPLYVLLCNMFWSFQRMVLLFRGKNSNFCLDTEFNFDILWHKHHKFAYKFKYKYLLCRFGLYIFRCNLMNDVHLYSSLGGFVFFLLFQACHGLISLFVHTLELFSFSHLILYFSSICFSIRHLCPFFYL